MIYKQELTREVASYVIKLFSKYQRSELVYHNLHHTQNVINNMNEISSNYSLSERERFIVASATWFHDCGHIIGPALNHEANGVLIMKQYMKRIGAEESVVISIQHCILSTKVPNNPQSLLAEILCDADLYHLGTDDFFITDDLVRKEIELTIDVSPPDWEKHTLSFLENHHYFTAYCRSFLEVGKQRNIALLRNKINNRC